jgi:hypothetical protein
MARQLGVVENIKQPNTRVPSKNNSKKYLHTNLHPAKKITLSQPPNNNIITTPMQSNNNSIQK